MVHAFITSRIDNCNSVLRGASAVHRSAVHRPLQNVLNSAARITLRKQRLDRITAEMCDLPSPYWLPVQQRIEYKISVLVYNCLHQSAPIYLPELRIPAAATASRRCKGS